MKRPTGVTVLAVLALIGGVLGILASLIGLLGLGVIASGRVTGVSTGQSVGVLAGVIVVALILSILEIVFGVGALQLRPWAWTLGIGLGVVSLLDTGVSIAVTNSGFTGSDAISVVIDLIILGYLFTPRVREAFGRA